MFERLKSLLQTKASATGTLVTMHTAGRPVWTQKNYASLAREGYQGNVIGYRCIRMIAEAAASIPILTYVNGVEADAHAAKSILARPNPAQSGKEFFESLFSYLMVAGNAYAELVSLDGAPRELFALRPDRMSVVPSRTGWPEAFEYAAGGSTVRLPREQVLHLKLFHPTDDHYGLSPLEAACRAIDAHNSASGWNKAMLDNSARPSGALVFAGSDNALTTEQFERLKNELQTTYQGVANAGRPMILEGGLDWKEMGFSPKEMEFIEAKNIAAREVALAFGVPPMLLGIPGDNTYANFAEANRTFWRQTIVPLVTRVADSLAHFLAAHVEGDLSLVPDLDAIDALSADRDALWKRLNEATFLTSTEKREALGWGA